MGGALSPCATTFDEGCGVYLKSRDFDRCGGHQRINERRTWWR